MIPGRKVYDPIGKCWSTGYWMPIYDRFGRMVRYVPVWREIKEKKETIIYESKKIN